MSLLATLDPRYRAILCDLWGCVHDGVNLYPGAADRLVDWRREGRKVVLITNAPRTAQSVEEQLELIGLPREAWDGISTSGEAGIAALLELSELVGFVGTADDRQVLAGRGVRFADGDDFAHVAVTGLEQRTIDLAPYADRLQAWADRGVVMHCLNPDRVVLRGGVLEACAGAIADAFEALGGHVEWYGKPHGPIYDHALHLAGDPPISAVLAIGDSLITDILGAARRGIDCVFVQGGIHVGEPFPPDFGPQNGLGDWQPVAVVDSLR